MDNNETMIINVWRGRRIHLLRSRGRPNSDFQLQAESGYTITA